MEKSLSLKVIENFNLVGFQVLKIFLPSNVENTSEYFLSLRFDPKTPNIPYSTITGYRVTDLVLKGVNQSLGTSSELSTSEKATLMTLASKLKKVKIQYSEDYAYCWFLSTTPEENL